MPRLTRIIVAISSIVDILLSLTYFNFIVNEILFHKTIPFGIYFSFPSLPANFIGIFLASFFSVLIYLISVTFLDSLIVKKTVIKDLIALLIVTLILFLKYGLYLSINAIIVTAILASILYPIRQNRIVEEISGVILFLYLVYLIYDFSVKSYYIPILFLILSTTTGKLIYHGTGGIKEIRVEFLVDNKPPSQPLKIDLRNSKGRVKTVKIDGNKKVVYLQKDTYYFTIDLGSTEYIPDPSRGYISSADRQKIRINIIKRKTFTAKFLANGLPKGVKWYVVVNGKTYTSTTPEIEVIIDGDRAQFVVGSANIGNFTYQPNISNGEVNLRNPIVTIEFKLISQASWSPNMWIGKIIGNYKVLDIIGIGGTSYVLKVERDGNIYAMKIPIISSGNSAKAFEDFSKEFLNLKEISSRTDGVVRLYGIGNMDINSIEEILKGRNDIYISYPPYIVMEYMAGGNARELSLNDTFFYSPYWMKIVMLIASKVAYSLAVIHNSGYVHLDVKPQNIFFSSPIGNDPYTLYINIKTGKIKVKLGDLGSAKRIGEKVEQITPPYASLDQLEAVVYERGASPQMDIYSLGSTIYTLFTRELANPMEVIDFMNKALDAKMANSDFTPYLALIRNSLNARKLKLESIQKDIANLISSMLSTDPKKRPTAQIIGKKMEKFS